MPVRRMRRSRKSVLYYLNPIDEHVVGWIGGNAPDWFDNDAAFAELSENEYGFYCCFKIPGMEDMISIFVPEDFDVRIDENIYPNCSVKAIRHPRCGESCCGTYRLKTTEINRVNISTVPLGDRGEIPFITIGEDVDYVQDEEYYWNHLIRDGYRVYGVIDEYAYGPVDERMKMIKGNAPFCNGCVYLYRDDNDEIIVGFWQYS